MQAVDNERMGTDAELRVVVADDHPVVRGGLVALLSTLEGVEVVAQAGTGADALRETALQRPDVVVMDLRMPGLDGVEATRRIATEYPGVAVLVLTMFDEDELIVDAVAAGARGYLLKGAEPEEIERAIRAVASGEAIFSREVATKVLQRMSPASRPTPLPALTVREREVLDLIARGLSNAVIADRLGLAAKTVGNHISTIFLKLGVATRAEAIVIAREAGLGVRDLP
jgi:DNA-binding NarL/FixJ family response regulator